MALRPFNVTVPAGKSAQVPGPGNNVVIEEFSAPFEMRKDSQATENVRARGRYPSPREFRLVNIANLSSTTALTVRGWIGFGDMEVQFNSNPSTEITGGDIDLNPGDTVNFAGVNSSGQRRKQFSLTLAPALVGKGYVLLYNQRTGALLFIVAATSAGGGVAFESDDPIQLKSRITAGFTDHADGQSHASQSDTPGNISSANEDIAVAEEFYRA